MLVYCLLETLLRPPCALGIPHHFSQRIDVSQAKKLWDWWILGRTNTRTRWKDLNGPTKRPRSGGCERSLFWVGVLLKDLCASLITLIMFIISTHHSSLSFIPLKFNVKTNNKMIHHFFGMLTHLHQTWIPEVSKETGIQSSIPNPTAPKRRNAPRARQPWDQGPGEAAIDEHGAGKKKLLYNSDTQMET